jgi:PRC-barrel domain protein
MREYRQMRIIRAIATASFIFALSAGVSTASADDSNAPGGPPSAAASPATGAPPNAKVAPQAKPQAAPQATPEITVLNKHEVEGILGREVRSPTNENMGRIVDVLVDPSGQVRAAIIDFGGFLGVGSRKIAVDWGALHFPSPGKPDAFISLELTRDQVKTAPEYQDGKPVVVLGALGKLEPLPE